MRIYQYLWHDKKQGGNLYKHLRTKGKRYRKRGASKDRRGQIVGRIGIENRPKIVEEKTRFGDLEIDLVIGEHHKQALLTINDWLAGMVKIRKVESKEALGVEQAVIEALPYGLPPEGVANHTAIAKELNTSYYFAKPYHSWERGANENLNGLIRQCFPKKSSFEYIITKQIQDWKTN